jgi:hypothetical protein
MTNLGVAAAVSVVFFAALALTPVAPARADDSTIPCNSPPEKGARVAVHQGTQVSTTQDKQNDTCTFSINGAVATSPPPQEVLAALNLFRDPAQSFLLKPESAIYAISALIAAASPVEEVPNDLPFALQRVASKLDECLKVFFGKRDLPMERSGDCPSSDYLRQIAA